MPVDEVACVYVCRESNCESVCLCEWGKKKATSAIQSFLFNEEWKTDVRRCGYVPHINVSSRASLPHLKDECQKTQALHTPTTWEMHLMREPIISNPQTWQRNPEEKALLSEERKPKLVPG